jgi:galactose mutarotase-like enzyme
MNQTLENSHLTITVKPRGAELCSIRSAAGTEYIWQADPAVWPRHAPVLFPIVGRLANDRYSIDGKSWELKQHGFARDMDFELEERTANSLLYSLLPSEATRRQYPFEFVLRIRYALAKSGLEIGYEVTNAGRTVMPFSIGAHPGFSLALEPGDRMEDYDLQFDRPGPMDTHLLNADHLVSGETVRVLEAGCDAISLRRDLFDRDALIFLGVSSHAVSLRSRRHGHGVGVDFPGFPDLGIWSKPSAAFVCIEPWHGHADPAQTPGSLMEKPGIIRLAPGRAFACSYRVTVL